MTHQPYVMLIFIALNFMAGAFTLWASSNRKLSNPTTLFILPIPIIVTASLLAWDLKFFILIASYYITIILLAYFMPFRVDKHIWGCLIVTIFCSANIFAAPILGLIFLVVLVAKLGPEQLQTMWTGVKASFVVNGIHVGRAAKESQEYGKFNGKTNVKELYLPATIFSWVAISVFTFVWIMRHFSLLSTIIAN